MILYHGTPYPSEDGLVPRWQKTAAHRGFAEHPNPETRAKAADHESDFIFATPDRSVAMAYAFKTNSLDANGRPLGENGFDHVAISTAVIGNGDDRVIIHVVGKAEAFAEVIALSQPTLLTIDNPAEKNFSEVRNVIDKPNGEWVSKVAIPKTQMTTTPVTLEMAVAAGVQFYEFGSLENYQAYVQLGKGGGNPYPEALRRGLIRPIHAELGLPPAMPVERLQTFLLPRNNLG